MDQLDTKRPMLALVVLLAITGMTARAQTPLSLDGQIDDLAFLHYYGTGTYQVGAQRVWVVRIPPVVMIRNVEPGKMGYIFRSALVLAVENFADFLEPDITKRRLFSVSGGLELMIPIGRLKLLRPYLDIGYGVDNELDIRSLITGTGVKAELLQFTGEWRTGLEPKIALAMSRRFPGLTAGGEYSEFGIKLTARHPLGFEAGDGIPDAGIYAAGSYLFDSFTVVDEQGEFSPVRGLLEFGVVIGFQTPRPTWFGFIQPPSLSLGYQFGNGFRGVKIGIGGDWLTPIPE